MFKGVRVFLSLIIVAMLALTGCNVNAAGATLKLDKLADTVNLTSNMTNNVTINQTIVLSFGADGGFLGNLDSSRSIDPRAITVELKTKRLVLAGPTTTGEKGAWAFSQASSGQQVQSGESVSGKWEKLSVDVDETINARSLFQRVNNTTADGIIKDLNIASHSLKVELEGKEFTFSLPAALPRSDGHPTASEMAALVAMSGVTDDDMIIMARSPQPKSTDLIFYQTIGLLREGRDWNQSKAFLGDAYDATVHANGSFCIRTTTSGKNGARMLKPSQIAAGGV